MRICLNVCMSWKMPSHIFSSTLLLKKKSELGMKEREEKNTFCFFMFVNGRQLQQRGKIKTGDKSK